MVFFPDVTTDGEDDGGHEGDYETYPSPSSVLQDVRDTFVQSSFPES